MMVLIFIHLIVICGCNLNSKLDMHTNKILNVDEKGIDFRSIIKWDNNILEQEIYNETTWNGFTKSKIKRAIKYIRAQGCYGSCAVNSSARSMVLMNKIIIDYEDFLQCAKQYASSVLKYKNELSNVISEKCFYSILTLQNKIYKNDKEVLENILIECFENGFGFFQISRFLNENFKYLNVNSSSYKNFRNCAQAIRYNLDRQLPVLASFRCGEKNKDGEIPAHAINVINYKTSELNKSQIQEFLILNTWGGDEVLGILSFDEMGSCMNQKGYYYIMLFGKK